MPEAKRYSPIQTASTSASLLYVRELEDFTLGVIFADVSTCADAYADTHHQCIIFHHITALMGVFAILTVPILY